MSGFADENDEILWSGQCSWYRVVAWRWKDVAALAFLACAMTGFTPVMTPVDRLVAAVSETWFGRSDWQESASNIYVFVAMLLATGWFAGQVLGSLMSHLGRKFRVTRERIFWGNKGEDFSAPLSSIASMQEGRAADGGTVKVIFSDDRNDLLIAGVPSARTAARIIREAKANP